MRKARKRGSIPRFLRQPLNGIARYEKASGEEQMRLFAELVQRCGGPAVQKLWPQLDPFGQSCVMEKLGCFAGNDSPQSFFLPRFEAGRAAEAEVGKQIKTLKKYIELMQESVRRLAEQEYRIPAYEHLIAESQSALGILENIKTVTARHFGGPADMEIRSMIEAQQFVSRRSQFLGSPVTLSVAAIADILELNELGLKKPFRDHQGSIGKALQRFRTKPGYQDYMDSMEELLRDWTVRLAPMHQTNCTLK